MNADDVPGEIRRLFWEVAFESVDLDQHRDYVLERVITRGGWSAMKWLRQTYPSAVIGEFLVRKGRRLSPRDLAYWSLVTETSSVPGTGAGRPGWAGP